MSNRSPASRRVLPSSPFTAREEAAPLDLAVDDRVTHERHGLGRVKNLSVAGCVDVDFRDVVRRISLTSTKLHKL